MNNTLRILSLAIAAIMCFGLLSACGGTTAEPTQKPAEMQTTAATSTDETEPFVAPPDSLGKVVSADSTLITWNTYETSEETIDFMGVNVKELGKASAEMSLFYLEAEVSYYKVAEGKLNAATIDDVLPGCIVGVTTLEQGVQEVYIVYTPAVDDGSNEYEDAVEELIDEPVATTVAPTEDVVPDDGSTATEPSEEPTENTSGEDIPYEEPSLDEPSETTGAEEQ